MDETQTDKTLETIDGKHCCVFPASCWPPSHPTYRSRQWKLSIPMQYKTVVRLEKFLGCDFRVGDTVLKYLVLISAPSLFGPDSEGQETVSLLSDSAYTNTDTGTVYTFKEGTSGKFTG